MDFKSTKGIYLQIVDNLCRQILEGQLQSGDRVASVRDLAAEFEVNHNTVMRAYANLQESGIFDNKRGIGFFVSEKAFELIKANEKTSFFSQDLPDFLLKVKLLQLNSADLNELLTTIKNNDHENI
ncbi:GntR family transcriptional regulator [Flavobacterium sufflavum]|uniref:GntR family transcriptional regulator n=1 Tax=Flavobacterium sufflavum TaxID=1921138 RepID=A0A3S3SXH5_9FLAO|nr:GntR family transcriptional regulator [Flavobacterium sufflavum]RVT77546.1 GntR family transcriptional regulator [Flavobacterium sufflavum]